MALIRRIDRGRWRFTLVLGLLINALTVAAPFAVSADLEGSVAAVKGPGEAAGALTALASPGERLLFEDFESANPAWQIDDGVWQIGPAGSDPASTPSGTEVAGTVLAGNYPPESDSRLISPSVNLPALSGGQRLELRFWQWVSYGVGDLGHVEIAAWNVAMGRCADWQLLADPTGDDLSTERPRSSDWSVVGVDLTAFAEQRVCIAFHHVPVDLTLEDNPVVPDEASGWSIDAVEILRVVPTLPAVEGFEDGWGGWSTDAGAWQMGSLGSGQGTPYAGQRVARTFLDRTSYDPETDSRLISPAVTLPVVSGSERIELRYWQRYTYGLGDSGYVEVSAWDPVTKHWSEWPQPPTDPAASVGRADTWSRVGVDLTAFAGQLVRVAFHHVASDVDLGHADEGAGWSIDAVEIWHGAPSLPAIDGFEGGWADWSTDTSAWQIGPASAARGGTQEGQAVAGTFLSQGVYDGEIDGRLISPVVDLPVLAGDERIELRFWQWYAYNRLDSGSVEISTWDAAARTWSAWQTLATPAGEAQSSDWSRTSVDLTAFASQRIRLAFAHTAKRRNPSIADEAAGWSIDSVQLWRGVPAMPMLEDFENGWSDWSAEHGVWQVGLPSFGAGAAHHGNGAAGTILNGNYPAITTSRLVSPEFILPRIGADDLLLLRFWQWFAYAGGDSGTVQISQRTASGWSDWQTLSKTAAENTSHGWELIPLDLAPFAGQRVRLGFLHSADNSSQAASWYIDEVQISQSPARRLDVGQSALGTFLAAGDHQYYLVDVPPGGHLRFTLTGPSGSHTELYVRRGLLPTAGEFDYRFTASGQANQTIFVPNAQAGPWYVLAYTDSLSGDGNYTVSTDFSTGVIVSDILPVRAGKAVPATVTINGAGFTPASNVVLVQGATRFAASAVTFVSDTQLVADIDLATVNPGHYQIRVESEGSSGEVPFEVVPNGEAKLKTNLIVPSQVGYHAPATLWVEYANVGEVAMPAPLLVVTATQNERQAAILKQAATLSPRGFWTSALPEGFSNAVQFLGSGKTPGMLQPGEVFRLPVQYAGWQRPWDTTNYPPITFRLGVFRGDHEDENEVLSQGARSLQPRTGGAVIVPPIDWDSYKDTMRPAGIPEDAWDAVWTNFVAAAGKYWHNYVAMLNDNAAYLSRLGLNVTDVADLVAFEVAQADGLNVIRTLASATDAVVPAPGLDLTFRRVFPQSISGRYALGALGRGWSHNWDMALEVAPAGTPQAGTVAIREPGGARRIFQPDSRPGHGYFAMEGEQGTLTAIGGGAFSLREANGLLRVFHRNGTLNYLEDTNGNRITAEYAGGPLSRLIHSGGQTLQITYEGHGRIRMIRDPDVGRQTVFTYDASGEHLQSAQYFNGAIVSYQYVHGSPSAHEHALSQINYPGGTHQFFTYAADGRVESVFRDAGAERIRFSYDSAGTVALTDAFDHSSRFYLDHRGLVVKADDPQNNIARLTYDAEFNLRVVTDPAGRSYIYDYDDRGNLILATDPLGNATRFNYEGPFGRMTRLIDAKGHPTNYGYDSAGNLRTITYADASVEHRSYDAQGNADSWTNRRGAAIAQGFDAAGRLKRKTYRDGSHIDYHYDARGNLDAATDATGTTILEYDTADRLKKITYPADRWLQYTYNGAGQRETILDQLGHLLTYHYDSAGRLQRITDETITEIVHYHYDGAGRIERKELGNGVYTDYRYDEAWQVLSLSNRKPDGTILSQFQYTYDSRGRRKTMTTTYGPGDPRLEGEWIYDYDDVGQLTAWTGPDGRHVEYRYDALGNRITETNDGVVINYATNNLNQYIRVGIAAYEYDLDGNMSRRITPSGTTTYTYNDENRLTALTSPTVNWDYTYDASASRVHGREGGMTRDLVFDPFGFENLVAEYNDGALAATYEHGFGLLSNTRGGSRKFYSFDGTGNTSEISNHLAFPDNTYVVSPFGDTAFSDGESSNPFVYVGESGVQRDPTGLDHMRARYYSAELGRFASEDPLGLRAGDLNLYRYVRNDPVSRIDPLGLQACEPGVFDCTPAFIRTEDFYTNNRQEAHEAYRNIRNLDKTPSVRDFIGEVIGWLGGEVGEKLADDIGIPLSPGGVPIISIGGSISDAFGDIAATDVSGCTAFHCPGVLPPTVPPPVPPTEGGGSGSSGTAGSSDPNSKSGPRGYGDRREVSAGSVLPYRLSFENEAMARGPAQTVTVSDQLGTDLDWTTFELREISFGDTRITATDNTQHIETMVPLTLNGTKFEVRIDAGIHLDAGKVYASFSSIDPLTGLPPRVNVGFLPPEDGTGRGQGYISYVAKPNPGLPAGAEIRNVAYIVFDQQQAITTNLCDPHDPNKGTCADTPIDVCEARDPSGRKCEDKEALNTIAPETATLTLGTSAGGSVLPGTGPLIYPWGETVQLTAVPDVGYHFVRWDGDVAEIADRTSPNTSIALHENYSVTASFAAGPAATATVTRTSTPSLTRTASRTQTPTLSLSPAGSPSSTPSPFVTQTTTASLPRTPTATPITSPSVAATRTTTGTATVTSSSTLTRTPTVTSTASLSVVATGTMTATVTRTTAVTATVTSPPTTTRTPTAASVVSASVTPSRTNTSIFTPTSTPTLTVRTSVLPSPTPTPTALPDVDLVADAIEVTQAVQDLGNSVRLVAGKRTWVRLHAHAVSGLYSTTARLVAEKGNSTVTLQPLNPGGTITVRPAPNRGVLDHAFLFLLPGGFDDGTVTLRGDINPRRSPAEVNVSNNLVTTTVTFESVPKQTVVLYDVGYELDGVAYSTSALAREQIGSWLRRAYPLSDLQVVQRTYAYGAATERAGRLIHPSCTDINNFLAAKRAFDLASSSVPENARYYGMVDDGGAVMRRSCAAGSPGYVATGAVGETAYGGWDTDGSYGDWLAAHLLARSYGRPRAGFCGVSRRASYPYPKGRISPLQSGPEALFGFDVLTRDVYGPDWKDLMTNCDYRWVSDFTYEGLLDAFQGNAARQARLSRQALGDRLLVLGTLDPATGQVQIEPPYLIQDATDALEPLPGPYAIVLRNIQGTELARYPFTPREAEELDAGLVDEEPTLNFIHELVPYVVGTRRVEIEGPGGAVVASASPGQNAPTVSLISPNRGESITGGNVAVTWIASDSDGDPLSFAVQYSADDGASWELLAAYATEHAVQIDASNLGSTTHGRFRVLASDGLHTTSDDSDGSFTVIGATPQVKIVSPVGAATLSRGQTLLLQAEVSGGNLTEDHIHWRSSRDGDLGQGSSLAVTGLSEGLHTITVEVIPDTGTAASAQVEVTVVTEPLPAADQLTVGPSSIRLDVTTGITSARLAIDNANSGQPLAWTADVNVPWLMLGPNNGTTPVEMEVRLLKSELGPGRYLATVTVHAERGDPVDIAVDATVTCAGDCDGDVRVSMEELVQGVNRALGAATTDPCFAMDDDRSGTLTIDELVRGVNSALLDCAQ